MLDKHQRKSMSRIVGLRLKADNTIKTGKFLNLRSIEYALNNPDQFGILYDGDIVIGDGPNGPVKASDLVKKTKVLSGDARIMRAEDVKRSEAAPPMASRMRDIGFMLEELKKHGVVSFKPNEEDVEPIEEVFITKPMPDVADDDDEDEEEDFEPLEAADIPDYKALFRMKKVDLIDLARRAGIEVQEPTTRHRIMSALANANKDNE